MYGMNHSRSAFAATTLSILAVIGLGLTGCSSSSNSSAATTTDHNVSITDPNVDSTESIPVKSGASTTVKATTTTAKPPATPPATPAPPTGPTVTNLTAATTNMTCAEAQANGISVSWSVVNAASVTIGIDGPGKWESGLGLVVNGYTNIPANCNDTQTIYVIPVLGDGTQGPPRTITITIAAA